MAETFRQLFRETLQSLGKAGMNALYPNDFDYYVVSLELVDSDGKTVEFLVFPVPPKSLSQTEPNVSNIKMNYRGVTSINYAGFVPKDIAIQGDFGRFLKILVGSNLIDPSRRDESTYSGNFDPFSGSKITQLPFSPFAKTGFGALKVLQAIHRKSNALDRNNKPYKLFFYNPALGDSFLVKSSNLVINQSRETNMLWQYNLALKAIAPANAISEDLATSLKRTLIIDHVQRTSNTLVRQIRRLV